VWNNFSPEESPRDIIRSGLIGSDQAWITMTLGQGEMIWTEKDGVYSFRNNVSLRPQRDLPSNCRIVFFHGKHNPWDADIQRRYPWVRRYYHGI